MSSKQDASGKLALRLPKSLHLAARALAEHDGVSLNTWVVGAVSAAVAKQEGRTMTAILDTARAAGKAWAEREANAIEGAPAGDWTCGIIEAKPLLPDGLDEETEEAWLVACVQAARLRWDELVDAAEED